MVVLTPHYLQEKFNVILGKAGLVEQVADEVVNEDTPNDLKIVQFGDQYDEVRCLFPRFFLILWIGSHMLLVGRNRRLNQVRR